tara:strand:+ start:338 stop:598 length:261 start_codon:yes stop_codon:yes gene_type:complete
MLQDYLIWYRETDKSHDVVVAVSRTYDSARDVALQLQFQLKVFKGIEPYQIGVTRIEVNQIQEERSSVDFPTRWVVFENGIEIPEE